MTFDLLTLTLDIWPWHFALWSWWPLSFHFDLLTWSFVTFDLWPLRLWPLIYVTFDLCYLWPWPFELWLWPLWPLIFWSWLFDLWHFDLWPWKCTKWPQINSAHLWPLSYLGTIYQSPSSIGSRDMRETDRQTDRQTHRYTHTHRCHRPPYSCPLRWGNYNNSRGIVLLIIESSLMTAF